MSRQLVSTLLGGGEATVAVPLALATAARIQERDWEDFLEDPTQLANGVRDLVDAVAPDGVPVSHDDVLLEEAAGWGPWGEGPHARASLEATARLRQSLGDRAALVAVLPGPGRLAAARGIEGPAASEAVVELGKQFLAAGVEVLVVRDDSPERTSLSTLANIARFHRSLAVQVGADGTGLPPASVRPLEGPSPGAGVVLTDQHLPRDIEIPAVKDWIDGVRP